MDFFRAYLWACTFVTVTLFVGWSIFAIVASDFSPRPIGEYLFALVLIAVYTFGAMTIIGIPFHLLLKKSTRLHIRFSYTMCGAVSGCAIAWLLFSRVDERAWFLYTVGLFTVAGAAAGVIFWQKYARGV